MISEITENNTVEMYHKETHIYSSGSPLTGWVVNETWWTFQQGSSSSLFCRRSSWKVQTWIKTFTFWLCPSCISSVGHSVRHPSRCPDSCFREVAVAQEMPQLWVSTSWHLLEKVSVGQQGSWSCPAPSCWSRTPSSEVGNVEKFP